MPKLIRLYIVNVAIGFALAVAFTAMLVMLDVANLRHLIFADPMGWVAVFMLVVFHTALFAGVQFAIAVMSLARDDTGSGKGRRMPVLLQPHPVPVPVQQPEQGR